MKISCEGQWIIQLGKRVNEQDRSDIKMKNSWEKFYIKFDSYNQDVFHSFAARYRQTLLSVSPIGRRALKRQDGRESERVTKDNVHFRWRSPVCQHAPAPFWHITNLCFSSWIRRLIENRLTHLFPNSLKELFSDLKKRINNVVGYGMLCRCSTQMRFNA